MNNEVESLIVKANQNSGNREEYLKILEDVMKKLYLCPKLYIALSRNAVNPDTLRSKPLISDKDKYPALYIFTSLDKGINWCNYYRNQYNGMPLLAEAKKDDNDFKNLFSTAKAIGVDMLFINEGADYACLPLKDFIGINGIEYSMSVSGDEIERILNSDSVNIELPYMDIIR